MSEVPTVTSIFESLPPGSTTQPESSAQGNSQTTNPALVVNSSQTQRNKLQNVPAFLNKLYGQVRCLYTSSNLINTFI